MGPGFLAGHQHAEREFAFLARHVGALFDFGIEAAAARLEVGDLGGRFAAVLEVVPGLDAGRVVQIAQIDEILIEDECGTCRTARVGFRGVRSTEQKPSDARKGRRPPRSGAMRRPGQRRTCKNRRLASMRSPPRGIVAVL